MTTEDAKSYLAMREIPQLFESLMTGLMYYRPGDHIHYLQECLNQVKEQGVDSVRWNLFIDKRKKTPLPPITPNGDNNNRSHTPCSREHSFLTDSKQDGTQSFANYNNQQKSSHTSPRDSQDQQFALDEKRGTPLPPIGQTADAIQDKGDLIQLPHCPIVLVMGGPGSGKATQCEMLVERYKGWVHLSMGDLLRKEIFSKGSADDKWNLVGTLLSKGEMAPQELTVDLIRSSIQQNMDAAGIILEGYPRTLDQVEEYNKYIERVDMAFVLDCEEGILSQRLKVRGQTTGRADDNSGAVQARLAFFKEVTLPAIKHFDDLGKLVILEGDRDNDEIFYDLSVLFDNMFYKGSSPSGQPVLPRPPSQPKPPSPRPGSTRYSRPGSRSGSRAGTSPRGARPGSRTGSRGVGRLSRPGSGFNNVSSLVDVEVHDSGRVDGMPQCPIFSILGGPGSGRSVHSRRLQDQFPGLVRLSVSELLRQSCLEQNSGDSHWDRVRQTMAEGDLAPEDVSLNLLTSALREQSEATAIVIDGYPRTKTQVEDFNRHIGGLTAAVLLDCEEQTMRRRLAARAKHVPRDDDAEAALANRIKAYKYDTLPILGHIDDIGKLVVVNADRESDDEIYADVREALEYNLPGASPRSDATRGQTVERLEVSVADMGRLPDKPQCPIISIIGSAGSGVDAICGKVIEKYPGFVLLQDISDIDANSSAEGIILQGYPTEREHVDRFNETVGGLDSVIVVDCDEEHAAQGGGGSVDQEQLEAYKANTLPVLGHYDDLRKLDYVNGQRDAEDVLQDVVAILDLVLGRPRRTLEGSGDAQQEAPRDQESVPRLSLEVADTGRKEGLPSCAIVAVIDRVGTVCRQVSEKLDGCLFIETEGKSVGEIQAAIAAAPDVRAIVLENYPLNQQQLEDFNSTIGGMAGVVIVDSEEETLRTAGFETNQLDDMKTSSFPVLAHFEDFKKLQYVSNLQKPEEEVTQRLSEALEALISGQTQAELSE